MGQFKDHAEAEGEDETEAKQEMSPEEREWRATVHMAILEETRIFLTENKETIQQRAVARLKTKAESSEA